MFTTRKLFIIVNRAIYILAAAMLITGLVLTVAQQPALAQSTCGPNQELNNQGQCVCVAGYMFTTPDEGDSTAPFCVPQKVTVCHRNNGGVGYASVDVSINSVTSNEDWWQNGHGQHTIAGGEVGFPEDAWPDFYARNGDFIGAYGDQDLVANGCAAPEVNTPTATNTPVTPTNTPTATATSTSLPGDTPTSTPSSTSSPNDTPTATSTPGETGGGNDPTPIATLSQPSTSVVASTALLIPVTGMNVNTGAGSNKFTFSGLGLLGLGLVMSGIRKRFDM